MSTTDTRQRSDSWWHRRVRGIRNRPNFSTGAGIFLLLLVTLIGAGAGLARGMLFAFDIAAVIFLGLIAYLFSHSPIAMIRAHASEQDGGRWGVLWSSVAVAAVVPVALGVELHAATRGNALEIAEAAVSLGLAWFFLNTMFALHYAHEFYGRPAKEKALCFPRTDEPDYWDFMYFAFVIGMTFQVSDVAIGDREIRRIVLAHAIIAFFFNVVIVALSVNVLAGRA